MNLNLILKNGPLSFIGRKSNPSNETTLALNLGPGFLLAILANVLWGASFLASKYTLQAWGPFTSSSLRFGIATSALFFIFKIIGKQIDVPKSVKQWLGLLIIATTGFGVLYPLQLAGLKYIPSSLSAAIMLTSPLLVLLLGKTILKEQLTVQKWFALALGVLGGSVLLLSTSGAVSLNLSPNLIFGSILTFLSAACLAISVIATRKFSKDLSSTSLTFWSMAIGFLQLTIAAFIFEENVLASIGRNASLLSWMSLVFLALVCSAFCFLIWNYALSKTSPQEIASSMHIKTPTAVLIGIFIANEALTSQIVLGTFLVMLGVWMSQQKSLVGKK